MVVMCLHDIEFALLADAVVSKAHSGLAILAGSNTTLATRLHSCFGSHQHVVANLGHVLTETLHVITGVHRTHHHKCSGDDCLMHVIIPNTGTRLHLLV